jgi:hypothetical protein
MNKLIKTLTALALTAGLSTAAFGQSFTISWNTDGFAAGTASEPNPVVGSSTSGLITPINLTRGPDIDFATLTNSFSSNGWDSTDGGEYFEFGFTVAPGYQVDLTQALLGLRSSNTGPRDIGLFISTDSFTSAIDTYILPGGSGASAFLNATTDLSTLTELTGTVTMRFLKTSEFAADGGNIGGTGTFAFARFSDPTDGLIPSQIQGTVSVVPEPATYAAIVGLLALGAVLVRRRMRS